MQITRNNLDTNPGPGDWFTGSVFVDTVAAPSEGSQVGAASVHWYGAAATRFMTHIAMQQADDNGHVVEWGRHVSDDEYAQAPSLEAGDR
jgi:hypothetical protein